MFVEIGNVMCSMARILAGRLSEKIRTLLGLNGD